MMEKKIQKILNDFVYFWEIKQFIYLSQREFFFPPVFTIFYLSAKTNGRAELFINECRKKKLNFIDLFTL